MMLHVSTLLAVTHVIVKMVSVAMGLSVSVSDNFFNKVCNSLMRI